MFTLTETQQLASNSNALAFFLFAAAFGVTGGVMQWLILRKPVQID